jgi:hypothetical protein
MLYQLSYRGSCRLASARYSRKSRDGKRQFRGAAARRALARGARGATIGACSIPRASPELLTPAEMGEADRMTIAAARPASC